MQTYVLRVRKINQSFGNSLFLGVIFLNDASVVKLSSVIVQVARCSSLWTQVDSCYTTLW